MREQRNVALLLEDSPSLRAFANGIIAAECERVGGFVAADLRRRGEIDDAATARLQERVFTEADCSALPAPDWRAYSASFAATVRLVASRNHATPATAQMSEPENTPTLVSVSSNSELNASEPMNRLMVKPMPHSSATP